MGGENGGIQRLPAKGVDILGGGKKTSREKEEKNQGDVRDEVSKKEQAFASLPEKYGGGGFFRLKCERPKAAPHYIGHVPS